MMIKMMMVGCANNGDNYDDKGKDDDKPFL